MKKEMEIVYVVKYAQSCVSLKWKTDYGKLNTMGHNVDVATRK
jgi:hypothetical protein